MVLGWKGGVVFVLGIVVFGCLLENYWYKVGGMDLVGVGIFMNNIWELDFIFVFEDWDFDVFV